MNTPICKDCIHFRQHYILTANGLLGICCGHCTLNNVKHKSPRKPACDDYSPSPDIRDLFPRKNYVTKKLLEYLTTLEFLPDIKEDFSLPK